LTAHAVHTTKGLLPRQQSILELLFYNWFMYMSDCHTNSFCARLSVNLRDRLCRHCVKTTYAKGSATHIDPHHPWLLLDGMVQVIFRDRPMTVVTPGDMILTPQFCPGTPSALALSEVEKEAVYFDFKYVNFTPTLVATFSARIIYELFEDAVGAKAIFDSVNSEQMQMACHQIFLYHGTAYDSNSRQIIVRSAPVNPKRGEYLALGLGRR
jgi:hypothetical protein